MFQWPMQFLVTGFFTCYYAEVVHILCSMFGRLAAYGQVTLVTHVQISRGLDFRCMTFVVHLIGLLPCEMGCICEPIDHSSCLILFFYLTNLYLIQTHLLSFIPNYLYFLSIKVMDIPNLHKPFPHLSSLPLTLSSLSLQCLVISLVLFLEIFPFSPRYTTLFPFSPRCTTLFPFSSFFFIIYDIWIIIYTSSPQDQVVFVMFD